MSQKLSDIVLLDALTKGVARTTGLIARLTEYHGGPVETEYLLTSDIARELVEREHDVRVECLNRRLVNAMTKRKGVKPKKVLGSKRTDVVVMNNFVPAAIIEVKIRIGSFDGLKADLNKITHTMSLMNGSCSAKVIGVSVFQVHIPGGAKRLKVEDFKDEVRRVEDNIKSGVAAYGAAHPDFKFQMHSLQSEDDGIVGCDLEFIGDEFVWGVDGHATRYHAILIRSAHPPEPDDLSFNGLRKRSRASV